VSRKLASENATPIDAGLGERAFELRIMEIGIEMVKTFCKSARNLDPGEMAVPL
jgi:hypothetical protein